MSDFILLFIVLYFIYQTYKYNESENKEIEKNYSKCKERLKQYENDYTNGKYDFQTYKQNKENLLNQYNIPLDYKKGELS